MYRCDRIFILQYSKSWRPFLPLCYARPPVTKTALFGRRIYGVWYLFVIEPKSDGRLPKCHCIRWHFRQKSIEYRQLLFTFYSSDINTSIYFAHFPVWRRRLLTHNNTRVQMSRKQLLSGAIGYFQFLTQKTLCMHFLFNSCLG